MALGLKIWLYWRYVSVNQNLRLAQRFTLQEFESTLKEVVRAKRLSSSKMQTLTELALKSIDVRFLLLFPLETKKHSSLLT